MIQESGSVWLFIAPWCPQSTARDGQAARGALRYAASCARDHRCGNEPGMHASAVGYHLVRIVFVYKPLRFYSFCAGDLRLQQAVRERGDRGARKTAHRLVLLLERCGRTHAREICVTESEPVR